MVKGEEDHDDAISRGTSYTAEEGKEWNAETDRGIQVLGIQVVPNKRLLVIVSNQKKSLNAHCHALCNRWSTFGLLACLYKTKSNQSVHPPVDLLLILCMPVNHTLRSRLVLSRTKNIE